MSFPPIPGFGWTTQPEGKVELHPQSQLVVPGEFPGDGPITLLRLVGHEVSNFHALSLEALRQHCELSTNFAEELDEFLTTGKSNGREMKWHLMKIAPNTSFRLHAHQNIELIYVIKGSMNEIRLCSPPPKRIFDVNDKSGPALSDPALQLSFQQRQTTSSKFLVNEKGSIHLSYTVDEGAELLVLWSGGHGNIPKEHYPPNASEVLRLPDSVLPYTP